MTINVDELSAYLKGCGPETKLYLGADSERFRVKDKATGKTTWMYDVMLVVVVHIDGHSGCKIFGEVQRERDYDQKASRPSMRLMSEVYKLAELYDRLKDVIDESGFDVQIHLDLNPDEKEVSSIAINQAVGYIRASCNIVPFTKPQAFAATHCADRLKSIRYAS